MFAIFLLQEKQLRVGLRSGGGGSLGRVRGTRVASHPGNKVKVGRSRDAGVVVVPPLLEREDHRHADSQPSHEGESNGSLGARSALAHGIDGIHDGGVALGGGGHEGGEEQDVEDRVAQEFRHRGRDLLQQVGSHGEQGKEPVDDKQRHKKLEHGELGVSATQGSTLFERLSVRPRQSLTLAHHRRKGCEREEL